MNRIGSLAAFWTFIIAGTLGGAPTLAADTPAPAQNATPVVDFAYSFATPHRMTVARPDSSDKTLLDLEPGNLRLGWTYETLENYPLEAFMTPPAHWGVRITPQIDGKPFAQSAWKRAEDYLPILVNQYTDPEGSVTLEVTGGATAAIVKIAMTNTGSARHTFRFFSESQRGFFGYNPGYVDSDMDKDHLLAGWGERADRVIALAVGAPVYGIQGATHLCPTWELNPGESATGWIIRPYRAYTADVPALREHDWQQEADQAATEWRSLIGSLAPITLPDTGVLNAFKACFSDLFIMREPVAEGYIAGTPGTDGYRAPNSGEPSITSIVLDQFGRHDEAYKGYQMPLVQQGDDGDWADPKGWGHLCWGTSGFKAWTVMEHYRLTGDRAYLEKVYPRMRACSLFQEKQRARTRKLVDGERPLTYGLMPRGMGDCGLKDGDDLYGVFYPHNFWALFADKCSAEAADILGKTEDAKILHAIFDTAWTDLRQSLEKGCITEGDYRWIPGVPGKTDGSRWGAINVLMPCHLLPPDDPLVEGTLKKLRAAMSPGGLPINTGWMPKGLWVAIALDNLAEAHLLRGEGDQAAELMYATLNHATPLVTWCEERGQEPGAKETTGDRQHLWTPVAVVHAMRSTFLLEDGDTLHMARGTHRSWLGSGKPLGIAPAPTYFGLVGFEMTYDAAKKQITGKVLFPQTTPEGRKNLGKAFLHLRLPEGLKPIAVNPESGATLVTTGETGLLWQAPKGEIAFTVSVE